MKQSKILKILSYIAIPILVMSLVLSIFSIIMKENNLYNKEQYFSSDGNFMRELIQIQINALLHIQRFKNVKVYDLVFSHCHYAIADAFF